VKEADSAEGSVRAMLQVHRVYVGVAGLLFLERIEISRAIDSNFWVFVALFPRAGYSAVKKHKCILKVN
jgi:hypothetical protein